MFYFILSCIYFYQCDETQDRRSKFSAVMSWRLNSDLLLHPPAHHKWKINKQMKCDPLDFWRIVNHASKLSTFHSFGSLRGLNCRRCSRVATGCKFWIGEIFGPHPATSLLQIIYLFPFTTAPFALILISFDSISVCQCSPKHACAVSFCFF